MDIRKSNMTCFFKKREFCYKPIHIAANILDLRLKGRNVNNDSTAAAVLD